MTSFVIQNNSDLKNHIEYSLYCPDARYWYEAPKIVESSKLGYRGPNWNEMPEATHSYDDKNGVISFFLPQNHSAFVIQSLNYTGYKKNRGANLNILELKIKSSDVHVSYKGNDLAKAFQKRSKNFYIFKYR
jgi:hypothetical protein